ncbi:hypothetical protein BC628DRAFT_1401618 [Trametes gibbosa]|uniref:J domain-containing protein n=1 Tax=Trametes gibbosa TaxID=160864 RepID=A0A6G6FQC0_9APHY|nr:hypothetical protein BC628DRAFT_1401618 [Trametes gibbosa]QIE48434.1 hypothetical protein [Trametes gibbosa]
MATPTATASTTLYQVLGIDKNASQEEIRKAYRRRALQTHPDRLPQNATAAEKKAAEEQFRMVNNAYEVLNNEENRKLYDKHHIWPPPTDDPDYTHNANRSAFRNETYSNDPFLASPFTSRSRRGFTFSDPFELFNSLFGDLHREFDSDPFFAGTPFFHSPFDDPFFRTPFNDPFFRSSLVGPIFGGSLLGGSPFSALMGGPMFPQIEGGSSRVYSSRTEAIGQNGQWVSRSQMTRTMNGRTEVITKRIDAQGNDHTTYASPEGERYTINGVEQPSSRRIETPRRSETVPQPRHAPRPITNVLPQPASDYVNQLMPAQPYNVPTVDSAYTKAPPPDAYLARSHSRDSRHNNHRSWTSADEPPRRGYTTRTSPPSAHPPADTPVNGHTRHVGFDSDNAEHAIPNLPPTPNPPSAVARASERPHGGYDPVPRVSTRGYDAGGSDAYMRHPPRESEYGHHSRENGTLYHHTHRSVSRHDSREYYPDRERERAREREREPIPAVAPEQQPHHSHGPSAQQQRESRGW